MSNPYAPPPPGGYRRPDDAGPEHPGGPPGTVRPPAPTPPRPPVDPEAARAASRQAMHFGLLMLASMVTSSLPLPWQAAALVFAVAAVVVGVRALRAVWVSGLRGGLLVIVSVLLGLAGMTTVSLATMLALWPLQMERQECLHGALTIAAEERCNDAYDDALRSRLNQMTVPGGD